jgi:hypothetical protein
MSQERMLELGRITGEGLSYAKAEKVVKAETIDGVLEGLRALLLLGILSRPFQQSFSMCTDSRNHPTPRRG